MTMDPKDKVLLKYVGVGVAAALIVGLVVWMAMAGAVGDERERADQLGEQVAELESQVDSLAANASDESDAEDETEDVAAETDASDAAPASEPADSSSEDGRYFCFVREVENVSGTTEITVDYAEMLTGAEAAAAATAAGEESPPPNDYFISNVNPMLRTFPVEAGIDVTLVTLAEGVNPSGYDVVLGQWQDFFVGMSPGMERVRDVPYWIEIDNGTVTSIEEQYIP